MFLVDTVEHQFFDIELDSASPLLCYKIDAQLFFHVEKSYISYYTKLADLYFSGCNKQTKNVIFNGRALNENF